MNGEEGSVTLGRFLTSLADDPQLVEQYYENPERAMRDAGLSREDRDLILKGETEQILKAVQEEFGAAPVAYIIHPKNWPIIHP
jgi:hypothetical protein